MKRVFFICLLSILAITVQAQVNMKHGYIVTNEGDTICGMIDFRTNEMLANQCVFCADGDAQQKTYKPGSIESFRFDDGKFYVTRRLNVTGEPQLYFAEFIVHGKMNLYCVVYKDDEYFFFEREDGEMATLTNRYFYNSDASDVLDEKKMQYANVKSLLKDSNKAMFAVDGVNMNRQKLVSIVRDYHNDVCTDGSSCVEYEYKPEGDRFNFHFKAHLGYAYYIDEMTDQQHYLDENYPGSVGEFGIGLEIDMERVMRGFSVEADLGVSTKLKSEHDVLSDVVQGTPVHSTYEKSICTIALGGVKRFGHGKIQPLVRAGGFGVFHLGCKETRYKKYNNQTIPLEWNSSMHFGVYAGVGAQMNLGKHFLRLHGDIFKSIESGAKMTKVAATVEFGL